MASRWLTLITCQCSTMARHLGLAHPAAGLALGLARAAALSRPVARRLARAVAVLDERFLVSIMNDPVNQVTCCSSDNQAKNEFESQRPCIEHARIKISDDAYGNSNEHCQNDVVRQ